MTGLELLLKQVDEKVTQLQEHAAAGGLVSFEEYKAVCGEIKGLLTMKQRVKDLQQTVENSDE